MLLTCWALRLEPDIFFEDQINTIAVLDLVPCVTWSSTHWGHDKMAATFADDIFICIFLNKNILISNEISLKYVTWGLADN